MKILLAIMLVLFLPAFGCSQICKQLQAQAPVINAKLDDARLSLARLDASGVRSILPPQAQQEFDTAMSKALEGVTLAQQAIALGYEQCRDPSKYIEMIVEAWNILRQFVPMIGTGESVYPMIPDPVIWVEAQNAS